MNVIDFQNWVQLRDRQRREHIPVADKILPLLTKAGPSGLTRAEIGKAIDNSLDPDALDDLLAAGLVAIVDRNVIRFYRTTRNGNFPHRSRQV